MLRKFHADFRGGLAGHLLVGRAHLPVRRWRAMPTPGLSLNHSALTLRRHSLASRKQTPQKYRIQDTQRGPDVWEIRWVKCWRKTHTDSLVSHQGTLVVARNVLTDETKYFLSNRVPGRDGWSLRKILRVAIGGWPIEDCFRETKEELGLDHFECRSWHGIHRHLFVTILSQLFCARARQQLSPSDDVLGGELLTTEQVRHAASVVVGSLPLPPRICQQLYQSASHRQTDHARRIAQASQSHRNTCRQQLLELGIHPDQIKSAPRKNTAYPPNLALSS